MQAKTVRQTKFFGVLILLGVLIPLLLSGCVREVTKMTPSISLPKTFTIEGIWRVTVSSVEFLPRRKNLRFHLLVKNLQDKPAHFRISSKYKPNVGTTRLLDNLANEYGLSKVLPAEELTVVPDMPRQVYLIFPQLEERAEAATLDFVFTYEKLETGNWPHKELHLGPMRLEEVYTAIEGQTLEINGWWRITLTSYRIFRDRTITLAYFVENLQEDPANFDVWVDKPGLGGPGRTSPTTYLLDDKTNKYHITGAGPDTRTTSMQGYMRATFLPGPPTKKYLISSPLEEGVETCYLYLNVMYGKPQGYDTQVISFGPIGLN